MLLAHHYDIEDFSRVKERYLGYHGTTKLR